MVRETADNLFAMRFDILLFLFWPFRLATRFACSNALMFRLLASTAFRRGNR